MFEYQIGGSLSVNNPTYVDRAADTELYKALLNRSFCYVLTSRQMGKSSLRVQTRHRLESEGQGPLLDQKYAHRRDHRVLVFVFDS